MRSIKLSGTPKEIGRQHGRAYADDIRKCYEYYCASRGKSPDKLDPTVVAYVEKRCPRIVEEIEGIAEGVGMSYEEVLLYNHFNVVSGCTPTFFRHTEVGPIVAQNLDCERMEQDMIVVRSIRPTDGLAMLAVSFVGTVWVGNCINERGVCMTGVSAHPKTYARRNGASGGIIGADVMQNAETADEAFNIIRDHSFIGKCGCHLIIDATGRAIVAEVSNEKKVARALDGDFGFTTGLYESGEIEAAPEVEYLRTKEARRRTIQALYDRNEIEFTVEGMKKLLAHHAAHPGSVCRHEPWQHGGSSTTQSARIMISRDRRMLITDGPPCRTAFEDFMLDAQPRGQEQNPQT